MLRKRITAFLFAAALFATPSMIPTFAQEQKSDDKMEHKDDKMSDDKMKDDKMSGDKKMEGDKMETSGKKKKSHKKKGDDKMEHKTS